MKLFSNLFDIVKLKAENLRLRVLTEKLFIANKNLLAANESMGQHINKLNEIARTLGEKKKQHKSYDDRIVLVD